MEQSDPKPSTLDTLISTTKIEAENEAGLEKYEDLRIKSAEEYKAIDSQLFKYLKESLPLTAVLPRPPTLGEYQFLIKNGGNNLKELFEDNWNTATLNYSAAVEAFTTLSDHLESSDVKEEDSAQLPG